MIGSTETMGIVSQYHSDIADRREACGASTADHQDNWEAAKCVPIIIYSQEERLTS
jgi:hypothetical protein